MTITNLHLSELVPYENNPRNNDGAVKYVKASIEQFGFRVPIIIDKNKVIVAGHTRYLAAQELGLDLIPCIVADDLTPKQVQAFRLVDNKVAEFSTWDLEILADELSLIDTDIIDMQEFGFLPSSYQKIEKMFDEDKEIVKSTDNKEPETDAGNLEYEPDGEEKPEKPKVKYICPCCGEEFEVEE